VVLLAGVRPLAERQCPEGLSACVCLECIDRGAEDVTVTGAARLATRMQASAASRGRRSRDLPRLDLMISPHSGARHDAQGRFHHSLPVVWVTTLWDELTNRRALRCSRASHTPIANRGSSRPLC
jgi:hypothetical protein